MKKSSFCGMTLKEVEYHFRGRGVKEDHIIKAVTSFYRKGVHDFSLMNNIPRSLQRDLENEFWHGLSLPVRSEESVDGSSKHLFIFEGGTTGEAVVIPDDGRRTVCVSSQSGCRMGCPFCLTGRSGFSGNLSAGQIINQVLSVPGQDETDHVVFMGMGEPLDNPDEVLKACEILTSGWGLAISPRSITVSTVGITPAIKRFLEESDCNLTISLYSPFADERKAVVPAEKHYPAEEIVEMMKNFPLRKKRRLSVAYVMIDGINDSEKHLERLIAILRTTSVRVNLLSYHKVPGDINESSPPDRMAYFKHALVTSGISASVRRSRGADISAACGLLASGLKPLPFTP